MPDEQLPQLPEGLEMAIRRAIAALQLTHQGRGHVSVRVDMAPLVPATWEIVSGGKGGSPKRQPRAVA